MNMRIIVHSLSVTKLKIYNNFFPYLHWFFTLVFLGVFYNLSITTPLLVWLTDTNSSCTPAWVVSYLIGSRSRARHENWKRIFEIPYRRTIPEIPLHVSETYRLDHSRTCLACILHTSDFLECWRNGEKNPFFNSRIPNVFGKFDNAIGKKFIESMNLTLGISRLKIFAPFTICEISHVLLV